MSDDKLSEERTPGCFSKLNYFFFKQEHKSHIATYLELKGKYGEEGDYTAIENESILRDYGIKISELPPVRTPVENNEEAKQEEEKVDADCQDEETKHLLEHDSD